MPEHLFVSDDDVSCRSCAQTLSRRGGRANVAAQAVATGPTERKRIEEEVRSAFNGDCACLLALSGSGGVFPCTNLTNTFLSPRVGTDPTLLALRTKLLP